MSMSNKPVSSQKDPAALAFSAVENALRDSVFSIDAPEEKRATPKQTAKPNAKDRGKAAKKIATAARAAANDETFANTKLMHSMQSRASSAPLWIAFLLSSLWIAATAYIGWLRFGDQLSRPNQFGIFVATADFAGMLAIAVLPVLGFFAVAVLARRAQDLRIAAASMTQAAIRLAEPETTAADKVASVGQAVRREVNALGDGLERALSRAGELEVMVHNEVTSLERTYSDNELRLRSLIQELAAQRESVITNADRVREAILEAHTLMVDDIDRAGNKLSTTIVDRGEEVKGAFNSVTEALNSSLSGGSEKFVTLIDNRTADLVSIIDNSADRLNQTFDERASRAEETFDLRASDLANTLEERLGALTGELDSRAIAMSQSIDSKTSLLADTLQKTGTTFISDLESHGYAMNGALEAIGSRVVNDIGSRTSGAERNLTDIVDRLDENLSIKINSLDSRLKSALLEIDGAMEESTEKAGSEISGAGLATLRQIDARVEEVSLVIDSRLQEVDAILGDKGERIIESLNNHTTIFTTSANLLESALDEKTGRLDEVIKTQTKELGAEISNRTKEFAEKLTTRSQQLSEAMSTRTREFGDVLGDRTQKLSEVIETRTKEFGDTLSARTQSLTTAVSAETEAMSERIRGNTDLVTSAIRGETDKLATTIDQQANVVAGRVDEAMGTLSDTMESRANHVSDVISSKIAEVNQSIGTEVDAAVRRLSDAESGVTTRIDTAATNIAESADHAAELIESRINEARRSVTEMVDDRLGTLPEAITARADITADRLAALNENINVSIGRSMTDLEESADRIEETIGSRLASASLTISSDVEQTAARMDVAVRTALDQIHNAARHIEDLVEVKAVETAERLGERVEDMNRSLSEHTETFSTLISNRSAELDNALRSHGNILREALADTTRDSEELMSASTGRMLGELNEALKKLNDGNLLLQRVLETSTGNLSALENSISSHTSAYSDTVRDAVAATDEAGKLVTHHVSAMQATIGSMVGEFSSLLGGLNTETANINEAATALSSAGNLTIDTLENRRDAMEALVSSFTTRADEIDERMRSFAQSIAGTVTDTERRLVSARRMMDEALQTTVESVAGQIESLGQNAGAQGEQTAQHVREMQEALIAEMQGAFETATRRFADTAQAMRSTATQVGKELEATRSELQRGVMELPEETRASAAAMRRVVAEQIEALNELNAIVRAQPGTHDVSSRRRFANNAAQKAVEQTQRREEPQQRVERPQQPAPAPQRRERELDREAIAEMMRPEPQAPARQPQQQQQPVRAQQTPPSQHEDAGNGSWLRDVLRNASAKQQASTNNQARGGVNLSNLTEEVTRSMDDNALTEAWQRYRSGESNVFSRRIYTLTGQGTYDEVRKKLQRDPEFSATAQAYMDEFEQLLTNTASDPRAAATMQDQLTSDRGKVYTMLGHASGRLS